MTEPATDDHVEKAKTEIIERLDELGKKIEGGREQQSHEHGSLFTLMQNILAGVNWLKSSWRRFSILPAPPDDKNPKGRG